MSTVIEEKDIPTVIEEKTLVPIAMSLATSEGWWLPLAVFGYVAALELICNNVIEPLVFGHSTGVSPTALLISAAFWLYLWGPIGLVLSAPFAVCLVVLGKNIPQLRFLYLLLTDVPAPPSPSRSIAAKSLSLSISSVASTTRSRTTTRSSTGNGS